MPEEYRQAAPEPDEFDRQLRHLTSGKAEPARFTELSAAERARRAAARSAQAPQRKPMSWRNARKARKLRGPVSGPELGMRSRGTVRRPGKTRRPASRSTRQQRIRSILKTVGILLAFCALLFVLHLLGLGPQG